MDFVRAHAARIYAVVVAALALVAHYAPGIPVELVLTVVAAVLGTGELVQRVNYTPTTVEPADAGE
ncbi:hypothetical protein [Streptacidiphilus sp. P02-A3a]|uniref:hypothetical protein n=1 Tax=Streptacidiphilus sp. P02-A3a TaxID=2704468 RepID=UPI0015FD0287|nr:hypothetical protein [Streptacidiphilus sp. P02-A3a]QMU72128.1 hypothetical protein GXP74_31715 [Streptacidiphilus sp. P02-A3a]